MSFAASPTAATSPDAMPRDAASHVTASPLLVPGARDLDPGHVTPDDRGPTGEVRERPAADRSVALRARREEDTDRAFADRAFAERAFVAQPLQVFDVLEPEAVRQRRCEELEAVGKALGTMAVEEADDRVKPQLVGEPDRVAV
jgi:hypothetical protein